MEKKVKSSKENRSHHRQKSAIRVSQEAKAPKVRGHEIGSDVIELILRDHKPLKKLIQLLKDPSLKRADKEASFEEFAPLLAAHAKAEEQSLYVQMKEVKAFRTDAFEGDTEHAIADQLVREINATPDDDEWNAKVQIVAKLVEEHVEHEEEKQGILAEVKERMDLSSRQAIGEIYARIKNDLDILFRPRPIPAAKITEHRLN